MSVRQISISPDVLSYTRNEEVMQAYKILGARWYNNADGCIGVVAVQTGLHDPEKFEWKAYIGIGSGDNEKGDEQHVATLGNGLQPEEAHGFFPWLDTASYKDY